MRSALTLLLSFATWFAAGIAGPGFQRLGNGISLDADSLTVRILVLGDRTFRVSAYPRGNPPSRPSLVVTREWPPVEWSLHNSEHRVELRTRRASVSVDRETRSLRLFDRNGRLLVQEDPVHPHSLREATVSGEPVHNALQRFRLGPGEGIYGLGQFEDGAFNYRNRRVTLIQNNRHVVVPFIVSTRRYGILWDNYSHTEFRDGPGGMSLWSEVADGIDYYLIAGSTMDDVVAGYREATGEAPMFPKWAFGYWQSKERYESENDLMSAAREYRRRKLPIDNIVQDWQYWGKLGWNAMAFDTAAYPDPKGMIDSLHRLYNMHIMISIWPQVDSATAVYRDLKAAGHLFPTEIWNGGKTYDAYSEEARSIFWRHLNSGLYSLGVDAWWVDATEPDWKWCDSLLEEKQGIVANGMTALGTSARYLNTYALMATTGIYQNQRRANPSRRVVMLTRSAFAGQQRNSAAVWSGDISSTWQTFRNQIAAGLNFSMAGIPYWNTDIGGFLPKEYGGVYPLGNRDPAYNELYVRWFQFGAFCPVFRSHGTDFPKEIWRFGEPGGVFYEPLVRFDRLRYRLLPYTYSVAWRVTHDGYTMMRGLPMDFPDDPHVRSDAQAFMFGPSILAAPVTHEMYYPRNPGALITPRELRTPDGTPGLTGSYYRGKSFDTLDHVQTDSCVSFDWTGSGAPGVGKTNFTVRWEGKVFAERSGKYEFEVISDDGVNLFVDGKQILDEMYPAGLQMNVGEIELDAGRWYDIKLEYQQIDQGAQVALTWRTPSMLAAYRPNTKTQSMPVYLPPAAGWVDFWTGRRYRGGRTLETEAPLSTMPLFLKAGSIVPMGPEIQYATEKPADPLEVRVYRGADGEFTVYEDADDGYGYEKGEYALTRLNWNERSGTLTIGKRTGKFPGMTAERTLNVVFVRPGHGTGVDPAEPDRVVRYTGEELNVR